MIIMMGSACERLFKLLPNTNILDHPKLKAFADYKRNMAQN